MTAACRRIGTLVTRIQEAYLDRPGLALTLTEAEDRFRIDAATCRALFDLLVETRVLMSEHGRFRQRTPGRARGMRLVVAA